MPLRDVSLSDTTPYDRTAETHRQLIDSRERIGDLEGALRGLLGMLRLLSNNHELPSGFRENLMSNEQVVDAQELLR
jgi:hypothetical protein